MLLERLSDDSTQSLIVLDRSHLAHTSEPVERRVVEVVDVRHVRVGDHDVGQRLHVAESMGYSGVQCKHRMWSRDWHRAGPCWKLLPDIVGGADEARLGERAPEDGQLAETDRACFSLYPSAVVFLSLGFS